MKTKSFVFGRTSRGLPILAWQFGKGPQVLILGGVHGDEWEGVSLSMGLLARWLEDYPYDLAVTVVPQYNLDGVLAQSRVNARGVDLNRNLPTRDWSAMAATKRYDPGPFANSEPENQALTKWLEKANPVLILSLHSWQPVLNVNGNCVAEAEVIRELTGYKIDRDIGYPTPGCLGTYAGLERHWPTLTYEIERGLAIDRILTLHAEAVHEALKVTSWRNRQNV